MEMASSIISVTSVVLDSVLARIQQHYNEDTTHNSGCLNHDEETFVRVFCCSVEIIKGLDSHLGQAWLLLRVPVNLIGHVV